MSETCPWCGGLFAPVPGGATHAYMLSTPGCWAAYGAVLAREYSDAVLFGQAHRLTVDAYALQHPGDPSDRRARQSFWIHGASLWLVLRMGRPHAEAIGALKKLAKGEYPAPPERTTFAMTHGDLLAAPVTDHTRLAKEWAEAALRGWEAVNSDFERLAALALDR